MSDRKGFTAIWTVENPGSLIEGTPVYSPDFNNTIDGTQWKMKVHRGINGNILPGISALSANVTDVEKTISILNGVDWVRCSETWILGLYITQGMYFGKGDTTIKNLTIRCQMWKKGAELDESKIVFLRTRIGDELLSFVWHLEDCGTLQPPVRRHLDFTGKVKQFKTLRFGLVLNEYGMLIVNVEGTPFTCLGEFSPVSSNLKVSILDSAGSILHVRERTAMFNLFNRKISFLIPCLRDPNQRRKVFVKGPVLLQFQFGFHGAVAVNCTESIKQVLVTSDHLGDALEFTTQKAKRPCLIDCRHHTSDVQEKEPNCIVQDWRKMLEEGTFSDFTIKVGEKTFPVHRNVLSTRSSVFRAMLTSGMQEALSGTATIPDVDADTVRRFLLFLYTDDFDKTLEWEATEKLYFLADKYEVISLRDRCSLALSTCLSIENVCDALILSNLHQDNDLKKSALDFISMNSTQVKSTQKWKGFQAKYGKKGSKIL